MGDLSLVFMGSKEAGLSICRTLIESVACNTLRAIICPDDSLDERNVMSQFKLLAKLHGIPFYVVAKKSETVDLVKRINPSVVLVLGWYQILPVDDFPSTTFLGFHYSPLPKYRGNAPLVWQIINGESMLGVSFFQLTSGMDEGDLVDQRLFALAENESVFDALLKADELASCMIVDFLNFWKKYGEINLKPQPNEVPSYCGLRIPSDGRIDWYRSAEDIHNFIRAQSKPYPRAFCLMPDGKKLEINKATKDGRLIFGVSGSVFEILSDCIVVACGSGAIRLYNFEIEGVHIASPRDVLSSLKVRLT